MTPWLWFIVVAVGLFWVTSVSGTNSVPVIHTSSGSLVGIGLRSEEKNVNAYLGIPFAEAPIGKLRFKKPLPVPAWKGVLLALHKPRGCVQTDFSVYKDDLKINMSNTVEDCLFLNVWVPRGNTTDGKPFPVLMYLYGGYFSWGSANLHVYDGAAFATRAQVIYVTFNYRVGVLGFLNASSPEDPGNMGLYDQLEALRWINKNIQFFGGDPNAVTLVGHSAGAISVAYHATSPLSKGLFHRAVLLSGTPPYLAYADQIDQSDNFRVVSEAFNCYDRSKSFESQVEATVECLRKVDAQALVAQADKALSYRQLSILPGYGDELLPNNPLDLDVSEFHVKEILLGTMKDDGAFLVTQTYSRTGFGGQLDVLTAFTLILKKFMNVDQASASRIAGEYFDDKANHEPREMMKNLSLSLTDSLFDCGTSMYSDSAAKHNVTVFRYLFEHRPSYSLWPDWITGTHTEELPYFLGTLNITSTEEK
ncbi:unnamed protein product, partial [Ixodes hexagonus]